MRPLRVWSNLLRILSVILMLVIPFIFLVRYWMYKDFSEFFWGLIISFVAGLFVWHTTFYLLPKKK